MVMVRKRICFVGLDSYPVLNPVVGGEYFGGESVQQTMLAKAFRDMGYEVTLISLDYGQPQGEMVDGIRVLKTYKASEGVPVLRYVYPRMTSVLSALKAANADIYYQSCAGMLTGLVAWHCERARKQFVFRLAHDSDCIPGQQIIPTWRDRKIYEYGLRHADLVAAQGNNQVALLHKHYQLDSVPVNMVVELPSRDEAVHKDIDVLWVNNLREFKRPELVPELAELLPECRFVMIGGAVPGNEHLYEKVRQQAANLNNVDFLGPVPYREVNGYFARTRLFVNTSDCEGFPNSFLQAWVRRAPVLSFFDPDGLITRMGLGTVPLNIGEMTEAIRALLCNEDSRSEVGEKARRFVLKNYAPASIAMRYEALLGAL